MTATPDLATPDLATPVVGWRVWTVGIDEHGPVLVSPVVPCAWPARAALVASCRHGCGEAPGWSCSCGLYALARVEAVELGPRLSLVLGCAALWGRVVECTDGWRGQRAYPLLLFGQAHDPDAGPSRPGAPSAARGSPLDGSTLRELGRRYAVPLHRMPPGHLPLGPPLSAAAVAVARMRLGAGVAHLDDLDRSRALAEAADVSAEVGRGLAARRLGDASAERRLDIAVDRFLAALRPPDPLEPPVTA